MDRRSRSGSLALVAWSVVAVVAVVACAPRSELRGCATSEECPAGSRCISSACVANAPPSVVVALPVGPRANALLSFDASASGDRDPGDAIVSFAWAFRLVSGEPCAPPVVAGTGPVANVRFGCPGRYAVDVTATDRMGATSTRTEELDVAAHEGPALLAVGADVALEHVCTAEPRCAPDGPVELSASTPTIPSEQVSFAWTVEPPPDRPLVPHRRVAFSPGAASASPTVTIETDGEAISGDWIFRVTASDAAGVIGTAVTRVSVGNRPPTVTKTVPVPQHTFASSTFTAQDAVPFTIVDPDGDALLAPTVEARHTGDGGAPFVATLMDAPPRVTFSITVPYAAPDDALRLIGGPGLERTIVFDVADANGGHTIESWPIVVGNRRPVRGTVPAPFTVDHAFDPDAQAYVADVPLTTWSDPDGDPIRFADGATTGDPDCPEIVLEGAVAHARCRLAYAGTPAVGNFAGTHTVLQSIQDPWTTADLTSAVTFTIGNRPPTFTSTAVFSASGCTPTNRCCRSPEGYCDVYWADISGTRSVSSRWADPDGDPIFVAVDTAGVYTPVQPLVCASDACVLVISIAPASVCSESQVTYLATTVTDGVAPTTGSLPIQLSCL